ncbi:peptidylprolyl isomerase [Anabaena sp. CCY 0017]|uniref:peptidylprolyl isomerase n=1 Tax=Anabaena sp. CCY 0017 TaxID=3103866 RepID=UPI0039C5EACC
MSQILNISASDIIRSLKLSSQVPGLVEAIASQKIIQEAAQKAGISVTPEEVQQEGDNLRLTKKLVKAQDTLAWLEKHHLSVDDFDELVRNQVLTQKLADYLFASQVEKFFYQHQVDYVTAITYEVIFDDRDLALELFYAVEEGEITFPEIARLYIQDPELKCNYGYQGRRHRKDFRPEIAAPVFATTPPQILKPIQIQKKVHLIWVEEIFQPQLDEQLRQKIITELFSEWLGKQIKCTEIITQLDSDTVQPQKELLTQA